MSQNLKNKVLRNTSMKGVGREGEGERNRGAGLWGVRTWDVSGQTEGTGSLPGADESQGLGRLLGPDPTGGTGEVAGAEQSSPQDAPDSLGAEGLSKGAGAPPGSQGSRRKSEAWPHPCQQSHCSCRLQAFRNRGCRALAETPPEPAARGTCMCVAGLAAQLGQRKDTRF